ncbi:hypothetical protein BD414DRAFT_522060 [Trametes punicea]|nr:hypothetical protein BD414DRAFT_522060 [Trametes punicea]
MKRAAEVDPLTVSKRARPDPHVLAEVFRADQKRKAADICRKGTDGTGYIEGKVYERGVPSSDRWFFLLTVELGYRVQVCLAGSASKHFNQLPIAVGAHVRLGTRGLVLEDIEGPSKPLFLPKKFAWSTGLIIHVQNPKTGEECLVDTWAEQPSTPASSLGGAWPDLSCDSTSVDPRGRTQTPITAESPLDISDSRKTPVLVNNPAPGQNVSVAPLPSDDRMVADDTEPKRITGTSGALPVQEQAKSTASQSDSQNPQSLPSPPPELSQSGGTVTQEDAVDTTAGRKSLASNVDATARISTPAASESKPEIAKPEIVPSDMQKDSTDGEQKHPPHDGTNHSKTGSSKGSKKQRYNRQKKLKRLEKAGQQQASERSTGSSTDIRRPSADVDGEEYYWEDADTIPEDVLVYPEQALANGNLETPSADPVPKVEDAAAEDAAIADESKTRAASDGQQSADSSDPWESLRRGCVAGLIVYTPLAQFHGHGMRNVIGVVETAGVVTQTKTGEFMLRLTLYDATNWGTGGLSVTLFDKLEKGLPKLDAADILILRSIQIQDFNGAWALGPSYKGWQWAAFHVKTGMLSSAPADTCAMRHFKPEQSEVQFCIRLGDWWQAVTSNTTTFDTSSVHRSRRVRQHKTIAEAENEEYFDCTVEVLHGIRNDNGVYTVFVTDYTRNANVSPTQGEWCPPPLAPYVLRIEMWDSSADVGPTMQAGEYYSIRNLRTKVSGGGFLEGKMQEGEKITKLDEDQLENQPHLAELLKRKTEWEAEMNATGGVHEFPHQLIEEAEENRHFKCTVEVVHISPKDDFTYLYVTDYTARSDLVPVSASIAPSALAERVVRIELRDAQVDTAKNLEAGDFIAIRNLRLRPSGGGTRLAGRLGGDQRLITKLNPKASGNADLRALLSRREEWTAAQSKPKREGKRTATRAARQAAAAAAAEETRAECSETETVAVPRKRKRKAPGRQAVTLQEVKESTTYPAVFRVRARPVDFFPDDLRDCVVLRCTSCDENLPKTRRRCTKCDDVMDDETAVEAFFKLWFRIADETGTTLDVSVADERCSILQDLSPDDVLEDDDAFAMLVARVKPLLGGLLDLSHGEARRRPISEDEEGEDAPLLDLRIGTWLPEGEEDNPEARAYVVLQHSLCEDA